jgi:hypothetical protein
MSQCPTPFLRSLKALTPFDFPSMPSQFTPFHTGIPKPFPLLSSFQFPLSNPFTPTTRMVAPTETLRSEKTLFNSEGLGLLRSYLSTPTAWTTGLVCRCRSQDPPPQWRRRPCRHEALAGSWVSGLGLRREKWA